MAFRGITFDEQAVSAMNHGALFEGILNDGILRGCAISSTGTAATIAPGYLIAAGRLIRNDAAVTIPLTGTNGYARITLRIDLSQTATESVFSQLSTRVEYSDSETFPAITQGDINGGTDSVYDMVVAIVALGSADSIPYVAKSATRNIYIVKPNQSIPAGKEGDILIKLDK